MNIKPTKTIRYIGLYGLKKLSCRAIGTFLEVWPEESVINWATPFCIQVQNRLGTWVAGCLPMAQSTASTGPSLSPLVEVATRPPSSLAREATCRGV